MGKRYIFKEAKENIIYDDFICFYLLNEPIHITPHSLYVQTKNISLFYAAIPSLVLPN